MNDPFSGRTRDHYTFVGNTLGALYFVGLGLAIVLKESKLSTTFFGSDGTVIAVGYCFVAIGLLTFISAAWHWQHKSRATKKQMQFPDQPWMWRDDWAAGQIKSSAVAKQMTRLYLGLGCCGVSGMLVVLRLWNKLDTENHVDLLIPLFLVAGIVLLGAFAATWLSARRFGDCRFKLTGVPVPVGGVLEGVILTAKPLKLEHELSLRVWCVLRTVTHSGRYRGTTENVIWQDETIYRADLSLAESKSGGSAVPVQFKLPPGLPETRSDFDGSVFWELEAKSKMRGPFFHPVFDLPVFTFADPQVTRAAQAAALEVTAPLQASIEEIRREEGSRIRVIDLADGRDFYFPAARNLPEAIAFSLLSGILASMPFLEIHFGQPISYSVMWALGAMYFGVMAFSAWFKTSRVTVSQLGVRSVDSYLFFSRSHRFDVDADMRFFARPGFQTRARPLNNILLSKPGLRRWPTLATGIASPAEANWLAAEMNKALGRGEPAASASKD